MNSSPVASTPTPDPGLELVLCASWRELCDDLTATLSSDVADPFASQLLVVDAPAARRAISQHVALREGICATIDFVGLRGLRRQLAEELLGIEPGTDPWRSRGLALGVLDVMDQSVGEPWFAPVQLHVTGVGSADRPRPGRRLATADRIARLFLRYCHTCPELLRAWRRGELVGPRGEPLDEWAQWQPQLWRRVCDRLEVSDPVTRHDDLLRALTEHDGPVLPCPVLHLVNPNPCAPLDRELVEALAGRQRVQVHQLVPAASSSHLVQRWGSTALLALQRWQQLATEQRSVGQVPAKEPLPAVVQVHSSHGSDRQVEVMREALCGLFQDDPTLEPRDVLVACTDLDAYAPLVRAAFCLDPNEVDTHLHPGHQLRVQLADGSLAQPNQVLATLRLLLHLAGDRATAQDLVDLCSSTPVATRFDLGEDELERITRMVAQSDVRWGLDGRHRDEFGVGQVRQSTWLAGVDRVLTGVAMGPQPLGWLGTALPVEQIDSTDVMAAGLLAEIVSRTRKLVAQWRQPAPIQEWIERLHEGLDLLTGTSADDAWQLTRARSELADLADLTVERTALLGLGDVQALFDRLLRTSGGRPNFGNGSLLVCGLQDVAGIDHRVVVVLGLDDQRFPHRPPLDGDDLTATSTGADAEADPRARSRHQLLTTVGSATERLLVVHQGYTSRTNEAVPAPVALVDLVAAAEKDGAVRLSQHQHTLQPQSAVNFHQSDDEPAFSFDRASAAGARARELLLSGERPVQRPLWQADLGEPDWQQEEVLELTALLDFYRHPARELLRRRMGVSMTSWDENLADELPIDPTGLEEWAIGDRMVQLALDGLPPDQVAAAERLRGALPPGQLGSRTLEKLMPPVTRVVDAALRERQAPATDVDCQLALPDGQHLTGRVRVHAHQVVGHGFSRTNATHLLQAWFDLLLLAATQPAPEVGWRALHIGKDAIATLSAPPPEECRRLLGECAALRRRGLRTLVPLPVKAAATFTGATPLRPFRDHDPEAKAGQEFRFERDADWARFLGPDFEALRRIPGDPQDPGMGGPSRFENLSEWLFAPLREHLSVGNVR
ncbi:exodeoxyribonuclease V subunit gamma [Luteococcus sp. OSA5]|uniref:exodeoxyribonuclease V subunit gamma n=1 Tax=Luteococcus sp. OSA5 TaxID=3401630 RepID=UPI003B42B5C8